MTIKIYERKQIIESYEPSNRNAAEAKRILRERGLAVSSSSIIKIWKDLGYVVYKARGGKRENTSKAISEEDKQIIIKRYVMYNGSAELAAKSIGYSRNTIIRVWEAAGLRGKIKKDSSDVDKSLEDLLED